MTNLAPLVRELTGQCEKFRSVIEHSNYVVECALVQLREVDTEGHTDVVRRDAIGTVNLCGHGTRGVESTEHVTLDSAIILLGRLDKAPELLVNSNLGYK